MSEHLTTTPPTAVETADTEWHRTTPEKFSLDAYRAQTGDDLPVTQEEEPTIMPVEEATDPTPQPPAEDIAAVRQLILALHPAIVPELIGGDNVAALIASIVPAQDAYDRIAAAIRVPAGGNTPIVVDVAELTAFDKIRRGLAHQTRP